MEDYMKSYMKSACKAGLLFFCSLTLLTTSLLAQTDKGVVKVMTYNINEGSDFNEVLAAQTFPDFLAAVQITVNSVEASNPPLRMQAVAHQIAISQPDLVGLQEVTTWRVGPLPNPPVLYDMLQDLLDALKAQGQHYKVVAVVNQFQLEGPLPDLVDWAVANDTDVILGREEPGLQLSNVQSANYTTLLTVPTLAGTVTILRGWGSVDVAYHGQAFRFIVTHLENVVPQALQATLFVQETQAAELIAGPANTPLPVIIAGDFNANTADPNDPTFATHREMVNAGFVDAWSATQPGDPGLTWQLVDSSAVNTATQRIDYIFGRGPVRPLTTRLAGAATHDRIAGLWPSDHAGVHAVLQVGNSY